MRSAGFQEAGPTVGKIGLLESQMGDALVTIDVGTGRTVLDVGSSLEQLLVLRRGRGYQNRAPAT